MLHILNALSLAATLGLTALGLWVVFGLMNVVNVAHGELILLGAYTGVVVAEFGGSFWAALAIAPLCLFAFGAVCELSIFRVLRTRREASILAAFGLSIVLRELLVLGFGRQQRSLANPLPGAVEILGVTYPRYRLFVFAAAAVVLLGVWVVMRFSRAGLTMRAVVADRSLCSTLGVHTAAVDTLAFSIGAASAGLAGVLLAPRISIEPGGGLPLLPGAFLVVVIGGVRRASAVAIGAAVIAAVTTVASLRYDIVWGQVAAVALGAMILQSRIERDDRTVVVR